MKADVKPTRAELREVKRRLGVVRRGHRLLKRKQESLMAEFFKRLTDYRAAAREATGAGVRLDRMIALAEMASGRMGLWSYALTRSGGLALDSGERVFMGVRVPTITPRPATGAAVLCGEPPQNLEAAAAAERWVALLVRRAEAETALHILLEEIERTKRRVNALEVRLMPQLEETGDFIQDHLDEMEREGLFVLKRVRGRIQGGEK